MKSYLLKFWLCLFILTVPCICHGEQAVTIDDFLATATIDKSLAFEKNAVLFLEKTSPGSFLDEVEFRLKIEEFERNQQQFALRFKPRGFKEVQNEKQVSAASIKSHKAQYNVLLDQALKNRYVSVIDYLYHEKESKLYKDLLKIYRDRLNVLKHSAGKSDINPANLSYDLLDAENDLFSIQIKETEIQNRLKFITDEIRRYSGSNCVIAFDQAKMIDTNQILQAIPGICRDLAMKNAELLSAGLDSELVVARYDLEKSKKATWFSFIEAGYDLEEKNDFNQACSIEFGISLPIGGGDRPEIKERNLQKLKAKTNLETLNQQIKDDIQSLSLELEHLICQHGMFCQKNKSSKNSSLYSLWQNTDGTDPLILLKIRESMLKNEMVETKLLYQIYSKYIDLLESSGKLSVSPMINYLCDQKEL